MRTVLTFAMLAVMFIGLAERADAQNTGELTVTAYDGLNLRTGPGTENPIILTMPAGSWVSATGQTSGDWLEVWYGQTLGWAHSAWLASSENASTLSDGSASSGGDGSMADIIYAAAARYGVSGDWLLSVAQCESTLVPGAVGPYGEIGLFQFLPDTYYSSGGQGDIWNPYNQADLAAQMFAQGYSYLWVCA